MSIEHEKGYEDFQAELEAAKAELAQAQNEGEALKEEAKAIPAATETETSTDSQYTAEEQEAMKDGWKPNYEGPNKKSAKEFLHDGSYFKKINSQNKKIDDLTNLVKTLVDHNKKLETATTRKILADLEAERLQAIEQGDVDAFKEAELKKTAFEQANLKAESNTAEMTESVTEAELSADVKGFIEENKDWFNTKTKENARMAEMADAYDKFLDKANKEDGVQMSQKEHLAKVVGFVKQNFPHRFENVNQKRPSAVGTSTAGNSGLGDKYASKLTDAQLYIAKQVARLDKSFSIEDYAKQLHKTGELK